MLCTNRNLGSWKYSQISSFARLRKSPRLALRQVRCFFTSKTLTRQASDPRLGLVIEDAFAAVRSNYQAPKHAIILAHGLLGFDELHLGGKLFPGIEYWYGIRQALAAKHITVITAAVPPSASIEVRAAKLAEAIEARANGKAVNIVAHSMGGLDARYMLSRLRPSNVQVLSLTTIATPHRGSAFADYLFDHIGTSNVPRVYKALETLGFETGAFQQLTVEYMTKTFNSATPDVDGVRYYSYGASFSPSILSPFRKSHKVIEQFEGPNDGLVSVKSSQWGTYKGTLANVSHLDLINWTNRLKWYLWGLAGNKRKFNAIAFYLDIADMLAKEDL